MNLPNKITISRIVISFIILFILLIPWNALNITWTTYLISDIPIDLKYIVVGLLFLVASISDLLDGYLARSRGEVTDFGKMADAIADKILVNGLLIILAYERTISIIIPVVIVIRDIIVDSCKMASGNKGKVISASKLGKIKTVLMMSGLTLTLFYNLPFELLHFNLSEYLLIGATILSIISGCEYYFKTKKYLFEEKK